MCDSNYKFHLTDLYVRYQNEKKKNPELYSELYNEIRLYIYTYPRKYKTKEATEFCSEFLLYIEPRIPYFLERFQYTYIPFEFYLNTTLKYQFFTFQKNYYKKKNEIQLYEHKNLYYSLGLPTCVQESKIAFIENKNNDSKEDSLLDLLKEKTKTETQKKRLWWLLLKYSPTFPSNTLEELAKQFDINVIDFDKIKGKLTQQSSKIQHRSEELERKKNLYFSKCRYLERQIEDPGLTLQEQNALHDKLTQCTKKYRLLFEKVNKNQKVISNKFLAKMLNLPKGTIDSGIFLLKKYYRSFQDPLSKETDPESKHDDYHPDY